MKLVLLLIGCAVVLSHQQRIYGANKPGGWPLQNEGREVLIDEDTAEDFSEFLIARQANYAPQRMQASSGITIPRHSQAEDSNLAKAPSPFSRTNLGNVNSEEFQSFSRFAPRPLSWASIFGLDSLDPSLRMDDERARYFFNYFSTIGASSGNGNPLMKTVYYFTTATATSCSFISCVPASLFKAGSSTVLCRRKKRDAPEAILSQNANEEESEISQDWSPTPPEKIEASKMTAGDRLVISSPDMDLYELKSSMEEAGLNNSPQRIMLSPARSKRLFNNYFIYSTTLTTYSITVKTTTVTLSGLVDKAGNKLGCRPNNVVVCQ